MIKRKIFAAIIAGVVMTSLFVGCSKEDTAKKGGKDLTIWTKLPELEVPVLEEAAKKWGDETGNTVTVVRDDGDFQSFLQAANSSQGPDIYFGSAHNQLAAYEEAGIISEVPAQYIKSDDYINKGVLDAVSIKGKKYALPISIETTALYYNKDLVKEVPKTMDELVKMATDKGAGSFQFNINDPYTNLGFLLTNDGYIFGQKDGAYDKTDIGLNNSGSVKGLQNLQDLVVKNKFMPVDITLDIAVTNFKEAKSMFYISGPWDIQQLKDSKVNFGIAEIPSIDGKPYKALSGIQCGFVSSKSKEQDTAFECLSYLTKETQQGLYEKGKIPVFQSMMDKQEVKDNANVSAYLNAAKNAEPMPNIKAMDAVWEPMKNVQRVLQGEDPQKVADEILAGVKKGIELQN